jgi:hypothetical protein
MPGPHLVSLAAETMDSRHPAPPDQPPTPALPRRVHLRFNRRASRTSGLLFYRLLQQAAATDPHPLNELVGGTGNEWDEHPTKR